MSMKYTLGEWTFFLFLSFLQPSLLLKPSETRKSLPRSPKVTLTTSNLLSKKMLEKTWFSGFIVHFMAFELQLQR